jgi:hypothetical protein
MVATLRKQSALATLDPPNLCTTQGSGLTIELDLSGVKGAATLLTRQRRRNDSVCAAGRRDGIRLRQWLA